MRSRYEYSSSLVETTINTAFQASLPLSSSYNKVTVLIEVCLLLGKVLRGLLGISFLLLRLWSQLLDQVFMGLEDEVAIVIEMDGTAKASRSSRS